MSKIEKILIVLVFDISQSSTTAVGPSSRAAALPTHTLANTQQRCRLLLPASCCMLVWQTNRRELVGNHYAKLLFRIAQNSGGYVNNIKFCVKFRMSPTYDGLEDTDTVHVVYSRDRTNGSQPNQLSHPGTHTVVVNEDLTYSREHVASSQLHVRDTALRNTTYLIPETYVPRPDMSVEACAIC